MDNKLKRPKNPVITKRDNDIKDKYQQMKQQYNAKYIISQLSNKTGLTQSTIKNIIYR